MDVRRSKALDLDQPLPLISRAPSASEVSISNSGGKGSSESDGADVTEETDMLRTEGKKRGVFDAWLAWDYIHP